jgi:hypothetical protein
LSTSGIVLLYEDKRAEAQEGRAGFSCRGWC